MTRVRLVPSGQTSTHYRRSPTLARGRRWGHSCPIAARQTPTKPSGPRAVTPAGALDTREVTRMTDTERTRELLSSLLMTLERARYLLEDVRDLGLLAAAQLPDDPQAESEQ